MNTYYSVLAWEKQQLQLNRNNREMYNKHKVTFEHKSGFVNVLSCKQRQ